MFLSIKLSKSCFEKNYEIAKISKLKLSLSDHHPEILCTLRWLHMPGVFYLRLKLVKQRRRNGVNEQIAT